jgi:hypothetical protein
MEFRFNLGDRVKDLLTGLTGIVTSRGDHISGCDTYGVQAEGLKDGLPLELKWFDDPRLELVQASVLKPFVNEREGRDTGADSVPQSTRSAPTRG